jgi:TRAP-type C4-dicarboxylate transport system substrate-binding protein
MVDGFKAWAKAVEEKTSGNLQIQVFPSAQLGSDEDVIEQALQGVNVAVLTDGGRMANYVKDIGIIGMPYIADNYRIKNICRLGCPIDTKQYADFKLQLV